MFLRTADVLEISQTFYPVITTLGCAVQLLVLVIYRKDINRLITDMQIIVNTSNTMKPRRFFQTVYR